MKTMLKHLISYSMRYSLDDVWNEAKQDSYSAKLDGIGHESRLVYGIKITREKKSGIIEIMNTSKGGEFYQAINPEQLDIFLENGWRYGVYVLSLSNYRSKLDAIQGHIKDEVNGKNREKQVKILQSKRDNILSKYRSINKKLNNLN